WCWKRSATSIRRRRSTSSGSGSGGAERPRRSADLAQVLGQLLLRLRPEEDPARLPQPRRGEHFLVPDDQRDLRAPAQEIVELYHHLPARRLVELAADVLAGLDDHVRHPRVAADGLQQAQRLAAIAPPQPGAELLAGARRGQRVQVHQPGLVEVLLADRRRRLAV